jgi:hypothetical protein
MLSRLGQREQFYKVISLYYASESGFICVVCNVMVDVSTIILLLEGEFGFVALYFCRLK